MQVEDISKYHTDQDIKMFVKQCIIKKIINDQEKKMHLYPMHIVCLKDKGMKSLIADRVLSIEQLSQLNQVQINGLMKKENQKMLQHLNFKDYLALNSEEMEYFKNIEIYNFIVKNNISIMQFKECLNKPHLKQALLDQEITALLNSIGANKFFELNMQQVEFLKFPEIRKLLYEGYMNMEDFFELSNIQVNDKCYLEILNEILIYEPSKKIIKDKLITIKQFLESKPYFLMALKTEPAIRRLLIDGIDKAEELIKLSFQELQRKFLVTNRGRGEQNTHTSSVHNSASKSAKNLLKRYEKKMLDPENLNLIIKKMKKDILLSKFNTEQQKDYAIQCVNRLIDQVDYVDQRSNISLKQLLILAYLSISDNNMRQASFTDALNMFVEGLYEIQSGINLDDKATIDHGSVSSHPICSSGAFNKLIEKLSSIDPECEINYITSETAVIKLKYLAIKTAQKYLEKMFNDISTSEELKSFENIIKTIEDEGCISCIYEKIKDKIKNSMLTEFASIYNENDFENFISTGEYVPFPVEKLSSFKIAAITKTFTDRQSIQRDISKTKTELKLQPTDLDHQRYLRSLSVHPLVELPKKTRKH